MYKIKRTSHLISFTNMKYALDVFPDDKKTISDDKDSLALFKNKMRINKMRFRKRLNDYLDFLKEQKNISKDSRIIYSKSSSEGYYGVKALEINPDTDTGN